MAKKKANVCSTNCGCKSSLWVYLAIGALYLLKDLAVIDLTYGINWWTVLFILIPAHALFCKCCK